MLVRLYRNPYGASLRRITAPTVGAPTTCYTPPTKDAAAAFASLHDPASRTYYNRQRDQKKKHNAAIICLARRRCDVLFAMLRDGTPYQARPASAA